MMKAVVAAREESDGESDDENNEEFTLADEDNITTHIFDCLALLAAMQKQEQQENPADTADARGARNKVFMTAFSIVGKSLLEIDNDQTPRKNTAIDQLLEAFPVAEWGELIDVGRKGWLPLHWAVVLASSEQYSVTEADVKALYALDPTAMQAKHVDIEGSKGFTPAQLLCMSPVTQCSMQLVRSFSLCSLAAFGSAGTVSALHAACRYGTPTVELLQYLLQLDSSQAKTKAAFHYHEECEHCPLGLLCFNLVERGDELPNGEDLVNRLLEVDKRKEVVEDAVFGCLEGYGNAEETDGELVVDRRNGRLCGMIEMLLTVNPEAARYRDTDTGTDRNILHETCRRSVPSTLRIDIMKMVLSLHKDAVQEVDYTGYLPIHCAAKFCDVETLQFLLGLYPEAANVVTSSGQNLLHLAVGSVTADMAPPKVQYLCCRYPAMIQQKDKCGQMPVHDVSSTRNYKAMLVLYEAGGIEQFTTSIDHPTDATYAFNGYLPLHRFVFFKSGYLRSSSDFVSEAAGMFRWLLHLHPEAAGIEGGVGAAFKKTPYQLAANNRLPKYYRRLLLRAAPALNPAELHRLNYEQRRMAMFLAFKATTATMEVPLLIRLRGESKDLVQRVVSFL
jgi:hypothetical protein